MWEFPNRVHVSVSGYTSINGRLFNTDRTVAPVISAIVHLNQGKVEFISWDDGCFDCNPDGPLCIDDKKICGVRDEECSAPTEENNTSDCDLTVSRKGCRGDSSLSAYHSSIFELQIC